MSFFLHVFLLFFTKKKVIFFVLRVKMKKFKKMKKMPLFAFSHKAWGGELCDTLYIILAVVCLVYHIVCWHQIGMQQYPKILSSVSLWVRVFIISFSLMSFMKIWFMVKPFGLLLTNILTNLNHSLLTKITTQGIM